VIRGSKILDLGKTLITHSLFSLFLDHHLEFSTVAFIMLSISNFLTTSTPDAVRMASPPPPFPTSSLLGTSFCFFLRFSAGAGRTEAQSPLLLSNNIDYMIQSPASEKEIIQEKTELIGIGRAQGRAVKTSFYAATGVGLGLGLPVGREYLLSARPDAKSLQDNLTTSGVSTRATVIENPSWGIYDVVSTFLENIIFVSPQAKLTLQSPQPLAAILPHVFTSPSISPIMRWGPNPPTPESTLPRDPRFNDTPVYHLPSPVLPPRSHKRALRRPSPRRPRTCTADVEIKSPIFEYHISHGTTPYDRHGWDQLERFNASRGTRKPFLPPPGSPPPLSPTWMECPDCFSSDCVCYEPDSPLGMFKFEEQDSRGSMLPWMSAPVHQMPYTRLPPSPKIQSKMSHSPRPENHHGQVNHYRSEVVRRRLLKPTFKEPWTSQAVGLTPTETLAHRRRLLVLEERCAKEQKKERQLSWLRTPRREK
ncbi:hypothetical protein C8R43DRAFT_1207103, partial [Mycena crocata]